MPILKYTCPVCTLCGPCSTRSEEECADCRKLELSHVDKKMIRFITLEFVPQSMRYNSQIFAEGKIKTRLLQLAAKFQPQINYDTREEYKDEEVVGPDRVLEVLFNNQEIVEVDRKLQDDNPPD